MIERTKEQWLERAELHRDRVAGLKDRSLGKSDLWNPNMTIAQAIKMERRNVAFCLAQAAEAI